MREHDIDDQGMSPGEGAPDHPADQGQGLCPECSGTGVTVEGEVCPTCNGTGRVAEGSSTA
jgi:DnaJ-class molecular chaperone